MSSHSAAVAAEHQHERASAWDPLSGTETSAAQPSSKGFCYVPGAAGCEEPTRPVGFERAVSVDGDVQRRQSSILERAKAFEKAGALARE